MAEEREGGARLERTGASLHYGRLVGLVVKASVRLESGRSRVRIPRAPGFFSGSSHTSDFKIGTPSGYTLPGAWRYRGQHWDWSARCQYTVTG